MGFQVFCEQKVYSEPQHRAFNARVLSTMQNSFQLQEVFFVLGFWPWVLHYLNKNIFTISLEGVF